MKYYFENNSNDCDIYSFLKSNGITEQTIIKLRKKLGFLSINGITKRTVDTIKVGETLCIDYKESPSFNYEKNDIPIKIVYEDDYYLIVDKSSDVCTIPTISHYNDNLASQVLNYCLEKNEIFTFRALNRLDLGTSGIVVIAKDIISANLFNAKAKPIKKYIALCDGIIHNGYVQGEIVDEPTLKKHIVTNDEKNFKTNFEVIKYFEKQNASLLDINLQHGRTNQIRVHLASIGHPLCGDIKYGGNNEILDKFFLRCYYLEFLHPIINKIIKLQLDYNLPLNLRD